MSSDKQNENIDIKEEKLTRKEYYRLKRDEFNKKIMEEVKKERQKEQRVFVDTVKKSVEASKIQDIKEADNVVMVYGLFELFSKMSEQERKKLKLRSKEIEEVFLAERKARNKKKEEDENLEAEVGNGE